MDINSSPQINETTSSKDINSNLWITIKERIKGKNKGNRLIETWLDPISYIDTVGSKELPRLVLGVPSSLHQYFAIENLIDKIHMELSDELKISFEVDLIVVGPANTQEDVSIEPQITQQIIKKPLPTPPPSLLSPFTDRGRDILNPEYTFSSFVVGRNTEFAHAASYNVAQNPGSDGYNPLFICGPVGMGKTHLIHAVGNQIRLSFPHVRINYISAEKFLNECVSAIRRHEMDKFRQKYRETYDVLLVDDVQYIGRGEAVQEEFFHTINTFIERKNQIVVASDRMPKDILGLEDRSRSRLEWGLIADISMPDIETRVAILKYKAEKLHLRLNEEVVNYIARISKRSIRELEGNIKKVKMFSELQGLQIDLTLAKKVLANHESQTTISVEDIQTLVVEHYKVKLNDLKSSARAKQIVIPRQICMYLIKKHLDKSLIDIGKAFGGKDHTTVMNAIDRITFLQSKELEIKKDIEELTNRIHNITGL